MRNDPDQCEIGVARPNTYIQPHRDNMLNPVRGVIIRLSCSTNSYASSSGGGNVIRNQSLFYSKLRSSYSV